MFRPPKGRFGVGDPVVAEQYPQPLRYGVRGQLRAREQRALILANMIGAKLIGRTMEVPTEMLDRVNVSVDGGLGVVAAP